MITDHTFKPYTDCPELCVEELPATGDTCNQDIEDHTHRGDTHMLTTTEIAGSTVYTLTAEITDADGEYGGISTVHATLDGAMAALDHWLIHAGVDLHSAHWGEIRTITSLCNDADPDLLDGAELHWGINRTEVRA